MKQISVIETVGSITKVEKLSTIEGYTKSNTLVLRNTSPFTGYIYHDGKNDDYNLKNVSIFFALQYRYAHEKALRLSSHLNNSLQLECRTGFGEIWTGDVYIPCVRVKGLNDLSFVSKVQNIMKEHGYKHMPHMAINGKAKIRVYKNFKILEIQDGLYRDYYEREKFYISCPYDLEWDFFNQVTQSIKDQLEEKDFITALGELKRSNGPVRIIRVADKNKTLERAMEIKNLYLSQLNKEAVYH